MRAEHCPHLIPSILKTVVPLPLPHRVENHSQGGWKHYSPKVQRKLTFTLLTYGPLTETAPAAALGQGPAELPMAFPHRLAVAAAASTVAANAAAIAAPCGS